jgi:hypothetical protein
LRHEFFYGGVWVAASFSWLSHRLLVASVPLVYGVERRNLLQAFGIQLSAYRTWKDNYSTTLLEDITSWDVVSVTLNFLATRLCATCAASLAAQAD